MLYIYFNLYNRFLIHNNEGHGWVLKTPFSTNRRHISWPKSYEEVMECLVAKGNLLYGHIPYIMLQACMANKKEYKIVVLNKVARYVAYNHCRQGKAYSFYPHEDILNFATHAVELLSLNCPFLIVDCLIRVDIFKNKHGNYVVNEFESLDANCWSSRENNDAFITARFCSIFWRTELLKYIEIN